MEKGILWIVLFSSLNTGNIKSERTAGLKRKQGLDETLRHLAQCYLVYRGKLRACTLN
jgi:hypothetical protein